MVVFFFVFDYFLIFEYLVIYVWYNKKKCINYMNVDKIDVLS